MPHSFEELRACAAREVAMRRRVYPRWVEQKRMTQALADRELAHMEAIEAHFAKLAEAERPRTLFDEPAPGGPGQHEGRSNHDAR